MASEMVVNEFVAEAREHLNIAERDLLAMETGRNAEDPSAVNRVLRTMHSIKGASGTFGFCAVMDLSHAMESVLLLFRDGKMKPDRDNISILLQGVDKLRFMIDDIHASNEMDFQSEALSLKAILPDGDKTSGHSSDAGRGSGKLALTAAASASSEESGHDTIRLEVKDPAGADDAVFRADRAQIESAVSRGHYVCALRVYRDRDLQNKQCSHEEFLAKLESYGQCLDANAPEGNESGKGSGAPGDRPCHFLFATILESDLIGAALDIPDEQIQVIAPEVLQELTRKEPAPPRPAAVAQLAPELVCFQQPDKAPNPAPETIRVNVGLLDSLINLAGELVLGRNQLRQMLEASVDENPRLRTIIQNVNLVTSEMQEQILRMRMQPVNNILNRIRRLVRDLARQLAKEVELVVEGGKVELDKSILEGLIDPLIHIVRNCVDHGIETPAERIAKGKLPTGEIRLRAFHESGHVNIIVADDGRGMDVDRMVEKAIAGGILSVGDAGKMSEKERLNLVFLPGLSTATAVSDVSGRGVGMDVVKNNIERLGGHIELDSVVGSGTTIHITIPLTLAIIPSLIVGAAKQRFAIPQVSVRELVCIRAEDKVRRVEKVGDAPVLRLRERLLPLVHLADTVGLTRAFVHPDTGEEATDRRMDIADRRHPRKDPVIRRSDRREAPREHRHGQPSDIFVVVLRVGGNMFGLIVDELFDIEEIVVKPLSDHIKDCQCFAGATIMGDGRVAMILDAVGIAALARLRFAEVNAEQLRRQKEEQRRRKASLGEQQLILVFNNAPREHFAVPLSSISRLERIVPGMVERIGDHEFMTYRGKALPLIRLESYLPVRPFPESPQDLFVIIPKADEPAVGIMVSRIVDTFESEAVVEAVADTPRGFLGSALVEGQITMFLNLEELLGMFRNAVSLNDESKGAWKRREHETVCYLQDRR